ncbi:MAG: glycoside hydrolase family 32 protein [Clostridia bacterium]|nr:glycoside hydrolase family 32 protein [Clostridia bacterium]
MKIRNKYLVVRTDPSAPEKPVEARDDNGNLLFKLLIRADKSGLPYYLDAERFVGQSVNFSCNGKEFIFDGEADAPALRFYEEAKLRPALHCTVPEGWLNDPNGLVFFNGKYHVFCQHNPLGTAWGNMHWHHFTTDDFVNFQSLGEALFPDECGTMFSGSAICDTENVSGLGKNSLLLFYTIAEYPLPDKSPLFSQGLAYSTDGISFKKYEGNPIVPNIKGENRDPKVVFVPEIESFVMALYLDGDEYCFLRSDNLLDWTFFQSLHLPSDAECPDLYFVEESGKWVFSGASDCYIVGHFEKSGFVAEQEPLRYYRELDGRLSYAAQSFSGTGGRVLRMSWENIDPENSQCFCGQLSIPMEMTLVTLTDGTKRLKSNICKEMEGRLKAVRKGCFKSLVIEGAFIADIKIPDNDFWIGIDSTLFKISKSNNTLSFNENSIPLSLSGKYSLRLIVDTMSIEISADDGLVFSSVKNVCKGTKRTVSFSDGNLELTVLQ